MATTFYNDIQKLYVAYFNRPADPAGLAFWEKAVEAAAGSTAAVSAAFAGSDEYKAAYANQTNAQIVNTVYMNLFGRPAEDAGKAYWANLLDKGTVTIDAVVTAVAAGAQGTDMTAYNNKVTAAAAFTAAVDTDAEKAGYSGADANKVAKAFLAGVTDNVSLAAATTPTALNTSVASTVAAGTPFTVAGALASVDAAQTALSGFLKGLDADSADDVTGAYATAQTKVAGDFTGGADSTAGQLFVASTTTDAVRDALVGAQQATNSAQLSADQATLATDNANIAKVAGLTSAVSTLTAATTALTAAQTAQTAADADVAAKEASFGVNNKGTLSVADGHLVLTLTAGGDPVVLADIASGTGKATLHDGVTASDYAGLTDVISSYNADVSAASNVTKAALNVANAQLSANLLDIAADAVGTVGDTGLTEKGLIAAIATQINTTTSGSVASGATPTVAQIQTELAVLHAQSDQSAYTAFKALVDAETNADAMFNPLLAKQATDTATVKADTDAIAKLAKDVAALHTAANNVNTLQGLQATLTVDTQVLSDKGYNVVTLNTDAGTEFASAKSDVYLVNGHSETIAAFGLQGTDSVFVGKGYTLVQGAIGAKGVTANDAAKEVFLSTDSDGNAQLQIETHAYSSNVAGTAGEVVTITLTGVDATTLHLDSTGIISAGTTA